MSENIIIENSIVEPTKRGRGRPRMAEEDKKHTKSTKYEKYRETHGCYNEAQKRAYKKWYDKIKQETGRVPTNNYNKNKNKVVQEISNI